MKKKFKVEICRTAYSFNKIEVEAETSEEAKEIAIEKAGNYLYNESNVEYTAEDVFDMEMEISNPLLLTEEEFESKFTMVKNHLNKERVSLEGCMFETYGAELKYITSLSETKRVWTFLEDEEKLYFQTGICKGKRIGPIGYFITEKPYTKQTVVQLDWFH